MSRSSKTFRSLNAVTATGAGASEDTAKLREFIMYIVATGVTSGATIRAETQCPDGSWAPIPTTSTAVTATGSVATVFTGNHIAVRANVTARTDGTYSVWFGASTF